MLITASQLLTGPAGERIPDGAVLVRDGDIAAVGPRTEVETLLLPGEPVHGVPGGTVLPGLVDGHLHLAMDAGADPVGTMLAADPDELAAGMAERARQVLECGVTTVRDLGDVGGAAVRIRDAVRAGELSGPRILPAVAPLTPPRGHCWFFGGEVASEREMRAMVRRNADAGAEVVKVMASGGHLTPGGAHMWESQFTVAELAAVVDEAARLGLPVAAHAHGAEAIAAATDAGVSTIEHCAWMTGESSWEKDEAVARRMAAAGVAACVTVGPHDWRVDAREMGEEAARQRFSRIPWLERLGVPLLPGTDGGVQNAVFDDFAGALELYGWLGLPPARVIELATTGAAGVLGLSGVTGRLAPGLAADVVVVGGDPLRDLAALRDVRLVVAGAEPHVPRRAAPVS